MSSRLLLLALIRADKIAAGYNDYVLNVRPQLQVVSPGDRLESWKEIAGYLNRSVRTVRRWEGQAGLPIHRLQHESRGSVYAFKSELDAWRESRTQLMEVELPWNDPIYRPLRGEARFKALMQHVGVGG